MTPLEAYLTALREIRSSGEAVDETSYYGALETLFNEIGKTLKPKVRCVLQLKNRGAGNPDGGLFTEDQLKKRKAEEKSLPQNPARGVVEIKATSQDAWVTADGEQVSRYWTKYRQALVTNYRDFVFLGQDHAGKPLKLETYRLAISESDFWNAAAHPRKTAAAHEATFTEFARRAMLHAAPLAAPEDLASFLASYARESLFRIGTQELPALSAVRKALEEALGLTFQGEKGEHFFRSTLVQTLFYGVFSSWVLWSKQHTPSSKDSFDWSQTSRLLRVPVLRKLFYLVAEPAQMEQLNLSEILDHACMTLNRVDRASFFSKFQEGHAVQYFYEPFLQAFDPELRKQLGVWYTPPEIVQYMVARVDTVLREQLDLPDGLADKNVYVLDPCCGTGSYLVEVLNLIHKTLKAKGDDALVAADLKEAAKKRVFGFELLPAPFVVSHLQLGLLLQNLGAPLAEKSNERIGVFLTNALTGWEPPKGPKKHLLFPELEEERDAAEHVKRDTPILVILGNPPYNGFAGVAVEEERSLTTAYRTTKKAQPPQGQGLNDLYVRFYRMAEYRIAEMSGYGVVCFISNYSWLDGLSFTGMRESYLEKFDRIWIDSLNGDAYRTGKLTPEGKPDPSIFSTEWNKEGIQVGTSIGLLVKRRKSVGCQSISFQNYWGKDKRTELLRSLTQNSYKTLKPTLGLGLSFLPATVSKSYADWPPLTSLTPVSFPGIKTSRDKFLIDFDKDTLVRRMQFFFDPTVSYDDWKASNSGLTEKTNRFDPAAVRQYLVKRKFLPQYILRYQYRPFDSRWLYWEPETDLLDRKREDYLPHIDVKNLWIEARQKQTMEKFDRGYVTSALADNFGNGLSSYFPMTLKTSELHGPLLLSSSKKARTTNLSPEAAGYATKIGAQDDDPFFHIVSTLNTPRYRQENAGALRQDWPHAPLPDSREALAASADLGRQIAALLDTESDVKGVTTGDLRPELKPIAIPSRTGGGNLKETDLALKAGWGHVGKGGVTMPGKGKLVERPYSVAEVSATMQGAKALGLSDKEAVAQLGDSTCDVYLNDVAYWSNIPAKVWDYTIGGHQVIKKWLSYREEPLLGRPLTKDEVRYVQEMARRIAAILLLQPALDANYESVKHHTLPWPPKGGES
ncbi:MAG: type ISP restriction/modification enzyme [Candidatus Acidiferrales bacterium]